MILAGLQLSEEIFPGELITSLIIMAVIAIFSFVVYFKSKKVAENTLFYIDNLYCKW